MQIVFCHEKNRYCRAFQVLLKSKIPKSFVPNFVEKPRFHEIRVDKRRRDAFVTLLRRFFCVGFVPKRRNKTKPTSHLNIFGAILNSV